MNDEDGPFGAVTFGQFKIHWRPVQCNKVFPTVNAGEYFLLLLAPRSRFVDLYCDLIRATSLYLQRDHGIFSSTAKLKVGDTFSSYNRDTLMQYS